MGKENADLLTEILAARGELLQQLSGLRPETAWTRPEPKEWSVVEVLQHVADVDGVYTGRIKDILAGKTEMAGINPGQWEAARSAAEKEGLSGVLRRFYAAHVQVLDTISELNATDLERSGNHPVRGPMSVRQLVASVIHHDRDHAGQISKTRAVVEK